MSDRKGGQKIALRDRAYAELLTIGSTIASGLPARLNHIGKADTPSYRPFRWHHARIPFDINRGLWVHYDGISSSGITPSNYGAAAIILVDREQMDRLRSRHPDGNDSVSYRLGTTVMRGTSSKYELLGLENEDDEDYKTALRIGKGPLDARIERQEFPHIGNYYIPLNRGVRSGPVVPISEVPDTIPLL
jgi:hypothetical protein